MPPKPKNGPPGQFIFVGGPTLSNQSGNVRSSLLRRTLADKRTKRRQDAAKKLDSMIDDQRRGSGSVIYICTCGSAMEEEDTGSKSNSPEASQTTNQHRQLRPRADQEGAARGLSVRCPTCGGLAHWNRTVTGTGTGRPAIQSLSAGRSDPLLPVDTKRRRLKVHELLDFAATVLWPHFRAGGYAGNCYQSWVFPVEDNLLVYAVLWAASYHRDIMRLTYGAAEPQLESKEQLELKSLALGALQREIANLSETTSPDALVMCILYLAINEKHKAKIERDPSPFSPPFVNLQALDFYGSRDYHPMHWKVVQQMVQRIGGIQALQVFALAWLLSLTDLMGAIHTLSKPIYPIVGVSGKPLDLQPPSLLFQPYGHHHSLDGAGSGFHELFYIWPPLRQEIVSVFVHLGQYCSVVEHFSRETISPVVTDLLGDSRNLVHHRLLSLPDEHDPIESIIQCEGQTAAENETSREIYLLCRLSALLYAMHVTFPIPRTQLLRQKILRDLYPRFERLYAQGVSQPLILWCVAIATSMLSDVPPKPLHVYMARLTQDAGVSTPSKLVALLRSFAWVETAVQGTGNGIWERIFPL